MMRMMPVRVRSVRITLIVRVDDDVVCVVCVMTCCVVVMFC